MKTLSQRYIEKCSEVVERDELIKEFKLDLQIMTDKFNEEVTQHNITQDKFKLLQSGALLYTIDEQGYVTSEVIIPSNWHSTFPMEVAKEIGSTLYNLNRFYYFKNGERLINEEIEKKYKRSLYI